jgi:iron complex transport system ATP-binding protein
MSAGLVAEALTISGRCADVGAALQPGQLIAICGPNGAGKSSLLTALAGLIAADSGAVRLDDTPLAQLSPRERARTIGYLPQSGEVAWNLEVEALVALGRLPWGGSPRDPAVAAALAAMELESLRRRPVGTLSGGERARTLLARVLAGEPQWILADEPLASLDLAHAAQVMRLLAMQAAAGRGVVVVVHDLAMAMNHADRVLVLDRGALVADGPPAEALAEEVLARVWHVEAQWLGQPGARALALTSA